MHGQENFVTMIIDMHLIFLTILLLQSFCEEGVVAIQINNKLCLCDLKMLKEKSTRFKG